MRKERVGQEGSPRQKRKCSASWSVRTRPAFRAAAALSELNSAAICLWPAGAAPLRSAACSAIHSWRRWRANGEVAGFIGTPCILIMQVSAWPSAWLVLRVLAGRQRGLRQPRGMGTRGTVAVGLRQVFSVFRLLLLLLLLLVLFLLLTMVT